MLEEFLSSHRLGTLESEGRGFSLLPDQAHRRGYRTPDPWNFLLLLFAAAVEAGATSYQLDTVAEGWLVPALETPLHQRGLELACSLGQVEPVEDRLLFRFPLEEAWSRLKLRSYYSPVPLCLDGRRISGGNRSSVLCRPGRRWGWILVDRGISFPVGDLTPGWEVVAQTAPLSGRPWPESLVLDQAFIQQVELILTTVRRSLPQQPEPRPRHPRPRR